MQQVWRVSGDMFEKAIASAERQWTWAWLVLTASPVPRWAKYTHDSLFFLCGYRYGLRACNEHVIHGCWRGAGWTAVVELAKECLVAAGVTSPRGVL